MNSKAHRQTRWSDRPDVGSGLVARSQAIVQLVAKVEQRPADSS